MSVLIRGMEMPKSCRDCRFCNGQANTDYGVCAWCGVDGQARDAYTMQDCPFLPIPPHGRLIDADAMAELWKGCVIEGSIKPLLDTRPTIIEAEP